MINSNLVNIEDFDVFNENCDILKNDLIDCTSYLMDMYIDMTHALVYLDNINSVLSKITTFKVNPCDHINEEISNAVDSIFFKYDNTVSGIEYVINYISLINNNSNTEDNGLLELFDTYKFHKYFRMALEYGGHPYLGLIVSNSIDIVNGSFTSPAAELLKKMAERELPEMTILAEELAYQNMQIEYEFIGTSGYVVYELAVGLFGDVGKITTTDVKRVFGNAAGTALSLETTKALLAVGTPPITSFLLGQLVGIGDKLLVDRWTGDAICHTFEYDGRTYEIPENGNGEYGTFDAMEELYSVDYSKYNIAGDTVSVTELKNELYSDWDALIKKDTGLSTNEIFPADMYPHIDVKNEINTILNDIASCDNVDEACDSFYEKYYNNTSYEENTILTTLIEDYNFDPGEYYLYVNGTTF